MSLVTMGYQQRTVSRWVPLQTRTIEAHLAAARQMVPACSSQASTRQLAAWFWAHIPCCTHAALVIVNSMSVPESVDDSPARRLAGLASTHLPLAERTRAALTLLAIGLEDHAAAHALAVSVPTFRREICSARESLTSLAPEAVGSLGLVPWFWNHFDCERRCLDQKPHLS